MKKWILNKYFDLVFWWNKTKLERLLENELTPYSMSNKLEMFQSDTERKYSEGITLVKNKINSMVGTRSTENYQQVLSSVTELLSLAREETASEKSLRKILTSMSKLPEKNKKLMIEERIKHYEELKVYNEGRALMKRIKTAKKDNNIELAKELEKQWREQYGQVRNSGRR